MKTPNQELSPIKRPETLADVDLFGPGAPEHWYEALDSFLHQPGIMLGTLELKLRFTKAA